MLMLPVASAELTSARAPPKWTYLALVAWEEEGGGVGEGEGCGATLSG